MAFRSGPLHVAAETRREAPLIPTSALGMLLFILTEAMLFAGLISAFSIIKSSALVWPPPGQPRLPFEATAFNTLVLLASGVMLFVARRAFNREWTQAKRPLLISMLLGAFFVAFQGFEWVSLISQGLTLTSSSLGSFFYLIVGMHALHAVAALGVLFYAWLRLQRGWRADSQLAAAEVFWYFVVAVWPLVYGVVYL